jgi:hypothetical protein
MKKQFKYFVLALMVAAVFTGCKDDDPSIGDPWSHVEGLTSTAWVLVEVDLIDEGNPARPSKSLTSSLVGGDTETTLNFDADGTFQSIQAPGIQVFPSEGSWAFDRSEAPRRIDLSTGTDVIQANLGAPVRPVDPQLRLELVKRTCNVDGEEKAALGYRFVFNRVN